MVAVMMMMVIKVGCFVVDFVDGMVVVVFVSGPIFVIC